MKTHLNALLRHKGDTVHTIAANATVLEAVRSMNEQRIGSLLVEENGEIVGIFSERDVLCRVVDQGRDSAATAVNEVMTRELCTVGPETTVEEAMAVCTEQRYRHLPVMDGTRLLGIVSSGDLTRWLIRHQAFQIKDLVSYITDRYPR